MADAALQRAKARALGTTTQQEVSPAVGTTGLRNPSSVPDFVDADVRGTRRRIPTRVYDLPADQQQRFFDSLEEADQQQKDDNLALQSVNQMLDLRDKDSARVKALESQVGSLLSIVEALQRRIDAKDNQLELAKSDALVDAESQLAQTIVNAGAVKAQLETAIANSASEAEQQQADHRRRLEATERVVSDQEGRLKSSTQLMVERGNAVVDQLAAAESKQAQLAVQQTEISDGITNNRDTLKAFTGYELDSTIDSRVKRSFDNQLEPAMEQLIARKYVVTGTTTGSDGYADKRDDSAKPFLAEQQGDNATERAVNRALKRKGRKG